MKAPGYPEIFRIDFQKAKFSLLALLMISMVFMGGCETDFDVNAPYQDITIVYGILDLDDDTSYIKVNKAFLGTGNALIYASIPDSSYYPFEDIEVSMEEYSSAGPTGKVITFDTLRITNKKPGDFYHPEQVVYAAPTLGRLNADYDYHLIVKNIASNKEVTSLTGMVNRFSIVKPLYNPNNPITGFNATSPYEAEWISAANGKRYQLTIRFNYREKYIDSPDTLDKYFDWVFSPIKSKGLNGGEKMTQKYDGDGFFSMVEENILPDPDVERFAGKVDFIVSVAADDLNTYIEVNQPSNSVVQERPEFTNIVNGYGIFSARYTRQQSYYLNVQTTEMLINMGLGF